MIEIPERFVRGITEREGEAGRAWLATLPGLIEEFLQRWSCTPAGPAMHGGVGIILPVQRPDGSPAALKISFTHPGNVYEPDAFAAWGGHGALLLYERDDAHFAMLLERAGTETLACLGDDAAIATCGEILRRLAVPGPPHLPRLSDQAAEQEESVRRGATRFGRPLPARVIDAALATIQDLYYKQPDTLVHGDLHYGNVLRSEREPWLAIDPKGYVGDPAFDGITVLTGGVHRLLAAADVKRSLLRRLAIFADAAAISRERVNRWTQARAVIASQEARARGADTWEIQTLESLAAMLT